jgi:haloacetate dehalogenase
MDYLAGKRILSPLLVLWSARGPVGRWYDREGGPLGLWRLLSDDVNGGVLDAGHFFLEEVPEETAEALNRFFLADQGGPMQSNSPKP